MPIRIVQLGSPRHADEGLRIGTVRRPPRGVPKAEFASRDYYDVWYPELSPQPDTDRKSTRLNSSHLVISYAVFCLKKKKLQYADLSFRALLVDHDPSPALVSVQLLSTDSHLHVSGTYDPRQTSPLA